MSFSTELRQHRSFLAVVVLAALAAAASPAVADVLVTRDGTHVETRGPWEVKSRLVVFTLADGTLSSLRLSEVDLEASERATAEAARPAQKAGESVAATEAPRPAAIRLTDADFSSRRRLPADEETAEGGEAAAGALSGALEVTTWEQQEEPSDGHVVLEGQVRNGTADTATNLSLLVRLFNEEGGSLEVREAELGAAALASGEETSFRIEFPEVFSFGSLKFDVQALRLQTGAPEEPAAGEEGEAAIPEPAAEGEAP